MRHCHETKYIRDMDLAFYSVDYWACGCLESWPPSAYEDTNERGFSGRKITISPAILIGGFVDIGKPVLFFAKQTIFTQGDAADAVFYIQQGKVKLTVVSRIGLVRNGLHRRAEALRSFWAARC